MPSTPAYTSSKRRQRRADLNAAARVRFTEADKQSAAGQAGFTEQKVNRVKGSVHEGDTYTEVKRGNVILHKYADGSVSANRKLSEHEGVRSLAEQAAKATGRTSQRRLPLTRSDPQQTHTGAAADGARTGDSAQLRKLAEKAAQIQSKTIRRSPLSITTFRADAPSGRTPDEGDPRIAALDRAQRIVKQKGRSVRLKRRLRNTTVGRTIHS